MSRRFTATPPLRLISRLAPAWSVLSVLLALKNACLVPLLCQKELLIVCAWVCNLETLWDPEIIMGRTQEEQTGHDEIYVSGSVPSPSDLSNQCSLATAFLLDPETFRGLAPHINLHSTERKCPPEERAHKLLPTFGEARRKGCSPPSNRSSYNMAL